MGSRSTSIVGKSLTLPEDIVVFYWLFTAEDHPRGGTNSWRDAKKSADEYNWYVVAEGQSGEKKRIYPREYGELQDGQTSSD